MTDPIDAFLDAPSKAGDSIDNFLDAPAAPVRIKPTGPLTEKQLLHAGEGRTRPEPVDIGAALGRTANLLGGATTVLRGTGNIIGQAFAGSKWGDQIWPTESLDKDSGSYMLGQVLDPAGLAVGMGVGKAVQALPFVSKAAQSVEAAKLAERAVPKVAQITTQVTAPAITGAATGGVTGYAASSGDNEEAAKAAGYGGLFGGVLPSAFKFGSKVVGGAGDWLAGNSGKVAAADIARKATGSQLAEMRQVMANAPSNITAGQAAVDLNQPAWSALDAFAKSKGGQSKYYYDLAKEQAAARQGMLTGVTPDLATAQTNLKVGNTVNYGNAARADEARLAALQTSVRPPAPVVVPSPLGLGISERVPGTAQTVSTVKSLGDMVDTPNFKAAVQEAKKRIGNNLNIPKDARELLKEDPTSGMQGLHFVKLAIDDQMKNPLLDSSLKGVAYSDLAELKSRLTRVMTASSPEYNVARQNAVELYKPVNQSKVLTNLAETLDNRVGNERVLPFTNALGRGEGSALRKSGLDMRFGDTSEVLTPTQYGAVKNVEGQLIRDKTLAAQAQAGAGDLAGIDSRLRLPNMMNQKAALVNKVLEYADKYLNQNTYKAIAEGMRNGKTATEMLSTLPLSERNKALLIFTQVGQDLGNIGAAGAVVGNTREK